MCWSTEVAAAASACEAVVLIYCWLRNEMNDRRHVVGHIPILLQEVVQAVLWMNMAEKDTPSSCSQPNRLLSFAITCIVHAVPLSFAFKSWLGLKLNPGALGIDGRHFRRLLQDV